MARKSSQLDAFKRFALVRLFPLGFLLVGGFILFFGVRDLIRSYQSRKWPTVKGVIVKSCVASQIIKNSDGDSSTNYFADVQYEYSVNGDVYLGDKVSFGNYGSGESSQAVEIVADHPLDHSVLVYFMPDHPETSCLQPGMPFQIWFLPLFGSVFFCAGLVMGILLPKVILDS